MTTTKFQMKTGEIVEILGSVTERVALVRVTDLVTKNSKEKKMGYAAINDEVRRGRWFRI